MDDECLKGNTGGKFVDRIQDIRSSEKVMYSHVLDLYATAVDYDPRSEISVKFFKIVQNKLYYATHAQTAAEEICHRANSNSPMMIFTSFNGDHPTLHDVRIAKNYLNENNLKLLKWYLRNAQMLIKMQYGIAILESKPKRIVP